MTKPQWLKDLEVKKNRVTVEPDMCIDCVHLGSPVRITKHKNKERVVIYECDVHPKCFNTKYSIGCDDFKHK